MAVPARRDLHVAGIRSPLLAAGPEGASEAVLFVHGNPGSCRDWSDLVGRTGEFTRAVALDMPGFGKADKPRDFDYTVSGYATFLEHARSALGIERAHLVLHDFGGPWGLLWGLLHPDAFASVVLIDTGLLPGYRWHKIARIWRTPVAGEILQAMGTRSGFRLALRHGNPRGLPAPFVEQMAADYDRATRRAVLDLYRATPDPSTMADRFTPAFRSLDRPALVVWGRHDPYIEVEQAERQRAAFPRAEVHVLEESGHWPFADDPKGTAALVIPFLRRVAEIAPAG